jgi:hypothetical protein
LIFFFFFYFELYLVIIRYSIVSNLHPQIIAVRSIAYDSFGIKDPKTL